MHAGWGLLRVATNCWARAVEHLRHQGYPTYAPHFKEQVLRNRRRVDRLVPLFPNYGFVFIENAWRPIRSTPGVLGLVMDGEKPARVPGGEIVRLRDREDAAGVYRLDPPPEMVVGDAVRVRDGLFQGLEGFFEGQGAAERVIILLNVFNNRVRVQLNSADVEAVAA